MSAQPTQPLQRYGAKPDYSGDCIAHMTSQMTEHAEAYGARKWLKGKEQQSRQADDLVSGGTRRLLFGPDHGIVEVFVINK